jgi:8-oxo-dGTP pyrophosphatase MutT (NUDIX family)
MTPGQTASSSSRLSSSRTTGSYATTSGANAATRQRPDPRVPPLSKFSTSGVPSTLWHSSDFMLGAGMVVLQPETRRMVVVHDPRSGRWFLPKGRKDVGESLEQAALREAYEEVRSPPNSSNYGRVEADRRVYRLWVGSCRRGTASRCCPSIKYTTSLRRRTLNTARYGFPPLSPHTSSSTPSCRSPRAGRAHRTTSRPPNLVTNTSPSSGLDRSPSTRCVHALAGLSMISDRCHATGAGNRDTHARRACTRVAAFLSVSELLTLSRHIKRISCLSRMRSCGSRIRVMV